MFKKTKSLLSTFSLDLLFLTCALAVIAAAQKIDNSMPKQQQILALGEEEVKQLLMLMDTDKNGKIAKQEYLNFMTAELDRLDKDKSGELDARELAQSQIRASRRALGK
jgi:CRISPR/Cas system-associated endonuclease Cas3-HD